MRVPYDDFADIYDVWCASAPVTRENRAFYVRKLLEPAGPVVELGVGNGRICIEVAKEGKAIFGVDSSTRILELCRRRAREAGVSERLRLIEGDFRDFELPDGSAELVTIPFHSIGHLLTIEGKLRAFQHIHSRLAVGGRLIFDHFIFDPDYQEPGVPRLRAEFRDPVSGRDHLLWETATRDDPQQLLRIVTWTDEIDAAGTVVSRRYRRMNLSWISPEQSRELLERAGFEIDAAYGDFEEHPLTDASTHQVWVAFRP